MIKNTCETPPIFYNSSNVCILYIRYDRAIYFIYHIYMYIVLLPTYEKVYTCTYLNMYVEAGIYV